MRFDLGAVTRAAPGVLCERLRAELTSMAQELNIPHMPLASGASHDAAAFADAGVKTAMLFSAEMTLTLFAPLWMYIAVEERLANFSFAQYQRLDALRATMLKVFATDLHFEKRPLDLLAANRKVKVEQQQPRQRSQRADVGRGGRRQLRRAKGNQPSR